MSFKIIAIRLVLLSFFVHPMAAQAQDCQDRGRISGRVTDPSDALIVDAAIFVTQKDNRQQHQAKSNGQGAFQFSCLTPGQSLVAVSAPGFSESGETVTIDRNHLVHRLNIALKIAPIDTTIAVKEGNGIAESGRSEGTNILTQQELAGFADDPDDFLRELQSLASTAGGAPGGATVTVNGFQNESRLPPKSSIREIRINPDLFSAEYGKAPYGGKDPVTKSVVVDALIASGDEHALLDVISSENNSALRQKAIRSLGRFGQSSGKALVGIYQKSSDTGSKRAAIDGLLIAGDAPDLATLGRSEKDLTLKREIGSIGGWNLCSI